ncbi:MAG: U32 family peptidase, partial [Clostridia bacterium]|nr:U32 family peptidase [Clostridia bacterium]
MNKMKVLSPAGDMESLRIAIYNGADEVYLGVKGFNARNIEGFDLTNLKSAVDFAHIYNVRVFLAINILFSNEEIQDALNLIIDAYNLGIDAFIIQDIGLAHILHQNYPQIEIHASTQMGI